MTSAEKINQAIESGLTVYSATYGRVTKINRKYKAVKHWADRGISMFKMGANGELLMIDGFRDADTPKWSNAGCAKITAG